uniref:Uncharacterized protein n=1 Tax=Lepeophtheirus salmonis TaxID=72036 RepID=A0A0K2VAA5_LEPSM
MTHHIAPPLCCGAYKIVTRIRS